MSREGGLGFALPRCFVRIVPGSRREKLGCEAGFAW